MKLLSRSIKILFVFAILLLILYIGQSTDYKNGSLDLHSLDEEVIDAEPEEEQSIPQYDRENIQNDEADLEENIVEEDELNRHYGHYRITEFCPTRYYGHLKYDALPDQEADMMLGRTVIIEPDLLVTCDSERSLGTREGRDGFDGNYMIEEYIMDNPQYTYIPIASSKSLDSGLLTDPDTMSGAVGKELFDQIEGVITIPDLCSPFGTQYYYILTDENKVIMYPTLSMQYFVLEKISEDQENILPEQLSDMQKKILLEEVYGDYEITEFLPTKFYPALDSSGCEGLPKQEADMMLGQKIAIREEMFCTYDNGRQPNSVFSERAVDDFWIEKVEIENPEYRVESKLREDIYGLRDDMLPDNLLQSEYIEIDVFPGYYAPGPTRVLPQLFLVENGQIIMYAMGEYFLLEKTESLQEDIQNERVPDTADYSEYLKKIWMTDGWAGSDDVIRFISFVITHIENGELKGYLDKDNGWVCRSYFKLNEYDEILDDMVEFHGKIYDGIAECEYINKEGENEKFTFTMVDSNEVEIVLDEDETQSYLLVPYNISGLKFYDDSIVIEKVKMDSWGRVNLFYAILDDLHPYPWVLLINEQGDILYQFFAGYHNGSEVKEVIIEDMNGDGLKDVEVVTYFGDTDGYRFEWYFYQGENGLFCLERTEFYDPYDSEE